MYPKIKICGITNEKDALELSKLDIFALGFIISEQDIPSKIEPRLASKIIQNVPKRIKTVVGIDNLSAKEIIEICKQTKPDILQIMKGVTIDDIKLVKQQVSDLKIWTAVYTSKNTNTQELSTLEEISDAILIHTKPKSGKV